MALKTTPYDSAEYLRTEEERAAYLAACMEEAPEDAAFITHALGVVARSRNMSQLARDTGLTREGLYKAFSETGNPSFGTVLKVVHAMGYRLTLARNAPVARSKAQKRAASKVVKRTAAKLAAPKRTRKDGSQPRAG
jgi:probable addiction module antidote protein